MATRRIKQTDLSHLVEHNNITRRKADSPLRSDCSLRFSFTNSHKGRLYLRLLWLAAWMNSSVLKVSYSKLES